MSPFLYTTLETIPVHIYPEHVKRTGNTLTHISGLTFASTILGAPMKTVSLYTIDSLSTFITPIRVFSKCSFSFRHTLILLQNVQGQTVFLFVLWLYLSYVILYCICYLNFKVSYPVFGVHDSSVDYPPPGKTIVQNRSGIEFCSGIILFFPSSYFFLRNWDGTAWNSQTVTIGKNSPVSVGNKVSLEIDLRSYEPERRTCHFFVNDVQQPIYVSCLPARVEFGVFPTHFFFFS